MMNISVRIEQSGEGGVFFFGFYLFFLTDIFCISLEIQQN